ncbi:MAG: hypothetical protein ACYTAN_09780 [Planctomycetota bacterium]|jgi:hypothetical protein
MHGHDPGKHLKAIRTALELIDDLVGQEGGAISKGILILGDDGADLQAVQLSSSGEVKIVGNVAHDAVNSGNPLAIGLHAVAIGATPAHVAAADRVRAIGNRDGIPWVSPGHPNIERLTRKDTAAQTNAVLKSVDSGYRWVTTGYAILLDGDCSDSARQALIETGTTRIAEHPGIKPGSGVIENAGGAPMAIGANGDDLLWTCEIPNDGSITVQVSGYLIDN